MDKRDLAVWEKVARKVAAKRRHDSMMAAAFPHREERVQKAQLNAVEQEMRDDVPSYEENRKRLFMSLPRQKLKVPVSE